MNIGQKIKELRKARGWSQTELGQRLGIQKSAVSKYERGAITKFSQEQLSELTEAGAPQTVIRSIVGHKDANVTARYTQISDDLKLEWINKIILI